jgi:hypothetical protein
MVLDDVGSEGGRPDATMTSDGAADGTAKDGATDSPDDSTMMGSDSSTDAGPGAYAAYAIIGGLDRLRIAKTVGGTCFYIQLVSPNTMGGGLTLPQNWGFESARAVQPAAACNPSYLGPITNTFDATSQSGTIQFPSISPKTVTSVMATIVFANNPMWCPPSETFSATNIPVQ